MSVDTERTDRIAALHRAAASRILVLDGSWGAKIQDLRLTEEQFRSERFADHPVSLRGNTDLLCLTRPDVVSELLDAYLAAGADITSTNTFTATRIAQADYGMDQLVVEINITEPGALEVIRHLSLQRLDVIQGAGTVLDLAWARRCLDAGARFLTPTSTAGVAISN